MDSTCRLRMGGCRPEEYDEESRGGGDDGETEGSVPGDEIRRKYDRISLEINWSSMEEGVRDSTLDCFCASALLLLIIRPKPSSEQSWILLYVRPVVVGWSSFLSPDSSEIDNISSITSSVGGGEGRVCGMSSREEIAVNGTNPPCEIC